MSILSEFAGGLIEGLGDSVPNKRRTLSAVVGAMTGYNPVAMKIVRAGEPKRPARRRGAARTKQQRQPNQRRTPTAPAPAAEALNRDQALQEELAKTLTPEFLKELSDIFKEEFEKGFQQETGISLNKLMDDLKSSPEAAANFRAGFKNDINSKLMDNGGQLEAGDVLESIAKNVERIYGDITELYLVADKISKDIKVSASFLASIERKIGRNQQPGKSDLGDGTAENISNIANDIQESYLVLSDIEKKIDMIGRGGSVDNGSAFTALQDGQEELHASIDELGEKIANAIPSAEESRSRQIAADQAIDRQTEILNETFATQQAILGELKQINSKLDRSSDGFAANGKGKGPGGKEDSVLEDALEVAAGAGGVGLLGGVKKVLKRIPGAFKGKKLGVAAAGIAGSTFLADALLNPQGVAPDASKQKAMDDAGRYTGIAGGIGFGLKGAWTGAQLGFRGGSALHPVAGIAGGIIGALGGGAIGYYTGREGGEFVGSTAGGLWHDYGPNINFGSSKDLSPELGAVSEKFESGNADMSAISTGKGDAGGKSYGAYQFTKRSMESFFANEGRKWGDLMRLGVGSSAFDKAYKDTVSDPTVASEMKAAMKQYLVRTHYQPLIAALARQGIDLSKKGRAVQEALFSTSVQYGPTIGARVFAEGLRGSNVGAMTDQQIIEAVYKRKLNGIGKDFSGSSIDVQMGVRNRVIAEGKLLGKMSAEVPVSASTLAARDKNIVEKSKAPAPASAPSVQQAASGVNRGQNLVTPVPMASPTQKKTTIDSLVQSYHHSAGF